MGVFTVNNRGNEPSRKNNGGSESKRFLQRGSAVIRRLSGKNSESSGQPEPVVVSLGKTVRKDSKMAKVDMPWVKEQLTNNRTKRVVGDHVLALLEKWEGLKNTDPDPQKNEANLSQIVELFSKLALGHAIIVENKNEHWVPAQAGQIVIADEVRVKWNAFDGEMGKLHNGRRGKVVSIRYGDIIVKTTDGREPVLEGFHYTPQQLEKRVP
jgi:hypothetical protein